MKQIQFDRSRNETLQKCPRRRFLEFEYPTGEEAHGLMRRQMAVPLLSGGMVHRGVEAFLIHELSQGRPDEAVRVALNEYDTAIRERGIEVDELAPDPTWTVKVQRALIEALVLGWIRYTWPRIEAEFEVLDVEREERATFSIDTTPTDDRDMPDSWGPHNSSASIVLMARTDMLLRRRSDGSLFVRNLKTINEPQLRKLEAFRYDSQTISEVLAVEQRLAHIREIGAMGTIYQHTNTPTVSGVIYDLLVKGARKQEYPRKSGVWHNNSRLIWCWRKEGQTGITDDSFAASWNYTCTEPHMMGKKECPGGENHTLGKGWELKLVTDVFPGGISGWLDWLEANEPTILEGQFVTLPAIMRTPFDVATWKQSTLRLEMDVAKAADICREEVIANGFNEALPILDAAFPKYTAHGNCLFPSKCPMFSICWGTAGQGDPLDSEEFMPREANHPENVGVEE